MITANVNKIITVNFFDEHDRNLEISHQFSIASRLSPLFDHILLFQSCLNLPNNNLVHSDLIFKPRWNIIDHSGWDSHAELTISDAIQSISLNTSTLHLDSFDLTVFIDQNRHPSHSLVPIPNPCPSFNIPDDNQSVYTVNSTNALPENNTFNIQLSLPSLDILNLPDHTDNHHNTDNTNHNTTNDDTIDNEFPPDLQSGNAQILTRQYVRTVHELMGKDIVIPAPAIPHNEAMIAPTPTTFNNTMSDNRIYFEGSDHGEDADIEMEDANKNSYYAQICELNNNKHNAYHELLKTYPKRMIGKDSEKCRIWSNISIPSLSSFLLSKKDQRAQESDYNLLRLRMGTQTSSKTQEKEHLLGGALPMNNNNNNENTNGIDGIEHGLEALKIMKDCAVDGNEYRNRNHNGNSYYDQMMNNKENMNLNMNWMANGDLGFGIRKKPILELKDEEHGRTLRLDQDILAINLVQPWAHCIVNGLCKVFVFRTEFDSDKYPGGFWYAVRVHANRYMTKHVLDDTELLGTAINGIPVYQDCIQTAQHVIGFAHVYKSSLSIDDVAEVHPNLAGIYENCHGGMCLKKPKKKKDASNGGTENKKENENENPKENENINAKEESNDQTNHNDEVDINIKDNDNAFIVEDEEVSNDVHINDIYDGYWFDIDATSRSFSTSSPHKRKKKTNSNQRHYWFVDKVFKIEPLEVNHGLGGVSRFYNISKRNYNESVFLGKELSKFLFKYITDAQNQAQAIARHDHMNEDEDGKLEELPSDESTTLNKNTTQQTQVHSDPSIDDEQDTGVWIDRTLGAQVGIQTKNQKKLKDTKKISGWKNVLNDFSVVEVEHAFSEEDNKDIVPKTTDNQAIKNEKATQEAPIQPEPAVKSFEMFQSVGMIQAMDSHSLFEEATDFNHNRFEASRAPHIDDSSDSDYLGDEDEDEDLNRNHEKKHNIKHKTPQSIPQIADETPTNVTQEETDEDDDLDLADIEEELMGIVTKGGPEEEETEQQQPVQEEHDDTHTVVIDDINEELAQILHDENEPIKQEIDMKIDDYHYDQEDDEDSDMISNHEVAIKRDIVPVIQYESHAKDEMVSVNNDAVSVDGCSVEIQEMVHHSVDDNTYITQPYEEYEHEPMNEFMDREQEQMVMIKTEEHKQEESDESENEMIGDIFDRVTLDQYHEPIQDVYHDTMEDDYHPIIKDKQEIMECNEVIEDPRDVLMEDNGKHEYRQKFVFADDRLALNAINQSVYDILSNISYEEKLVLGKKLLRKVVAKKLNISKAKYKHLIDQCAKAFFCNQQNQ
eukprot:1045334_1